MGLEDTIPNYQAAIDWEQANREEAFLGVCAPICGVPVAPMTLRRMILLTQAGSPFFCGGEFGAEHIAVFLWVVSPDFRPGDLDARAVFLAGLVTNGSLSDLKAAEAEIGDYLTATFNDAPASGRRRGGAVQEPVISFAASIVHRIAQAYGWTDEYILDRPLRTLYQLLRAIALDLDPKASFSSRRSTKVKCDWLRAQQAPSHMPASTSHQTNNQNDDGG